MKHKILLACCIAILIALFSASPVSANPCEGRKNGICPLCDDCGCDWQPVCIRIPPDLCDPRHNPTGICTPCGEAWQPACLFESPACDPGTFNVLGLCVPCGDPWHPACPSDPRCDSGNAPLPRGLPVLCVPCGDTWYPTCPAPADPCDPWHNAAAICTPCGGVDEPLCWSGDQCKPDNEVEGWAVPRCVAKPDPGTEQGETGYSGTVPQQTPGEPLWGWVDTHEHQFANLAYGGITLWGEVFHEDGVGTALAECDWTEDPELEVVLPTYWGIPDDPPEFLSEWVVSLMDYIPTEYAGIPLDFVQDGLAWLPAQLLNPLAPLAPVAGLISPGVQGFLDILPWDGAAEWLESLLDQMVDWAQALLNWIIEQLEPHVPTLLDFLGPALARGLYVDLAPWDPLPPIFSEVPRYGIHGDHWPTYPLSPSQFWLGLTVNMAVNNAPYLFHGTSGYPDFEDWPTYKNGGHQQMYYKWVERAYQGGLRLLVNLTVNNAVLCEMSFQRREFADDGGCEDMAAVDRQIDAIYELEAFIDEQNDGKLDGDGWYRVALSASEARQIIEDGDMAVIIGIEVDTLFGCKPGTNYCCEDGPEQDCLDQGYTSYEDFIDKKVQEYYDKGVRYMYPVHFWDNKFTGGAPYRDIFVYAQLLANETCYELYDCSEEGYSYHVGGDAPELDFIFQDLTEKLGMEPCTEYSDYEAACNKLGLTEEGMTLIDELMERDMLIDQDHLPFRASWGYTDPETGEYFPGLLDIAEDWDGMRGYKYPVVSSHSTIKPDYDRGSEGGAYFSKATRIRDLGGVVSARQTRGECDTTRQFIEGSESAEKLLFSVGLEYTATLEAEEWSQDLWNEFATNGYTLTAEYTDTVEVETVEAGQEWRIKVPGSPDGRRFLVKVDEGAGDTLNVYHASYVLGYVELAEFMSTGLPEEHQAYPRMGLRSDFGAFLPQGGPRYKSTVTGTLGYCDPLDTVDNMLEYPFQPLDPNASGEFTYCTTGNKSWDLNYDGVAHVGLYPDLLADVKAVSSTVSISNTVSLDPIFNSAEAYIRMWEWIENCTPDEVPPDIICPGTIITTGGVGGATVTYDPPPEAEDLCDWIPPDVHVLTTDPVSGSVFETGVTTVWATATDFTGNASQCSFDVQMSCLGINHARMGVECTGIESLDLVYNGPDGVEIEVRHHSTFTVNDGDHIVLRAEDVGREVLPIVEKLGIDSELTTIPTSCAGGIKAGDVFGPFTVHDLVWGFADDAPAQTVEIKGTFRPAAPVDLTTVDVTYTIDDGNGENLTYIIPAGSFQVEGKPALQKFKFVSDRGAVPDITARFNFSQYTFGLRVDGIDSSDIAGTSLTIGLQTGHGMDRHYGLETMEMQVTPRHLEYVAAPQLDCSP